MNLDASSTDPSNRKHAGTWIVAHRGDHRKDGPATARTIRLRPKRIGHGPARSGRGQNGSAMAKRIGHRQDGSVTAKTRHSPPPNVQTDAQANYLSSMPGTCLTLCDDARSPAGRVAAVLGVQVGAGCTGY
jgi:hypothetical protein